VSAVSSISPLKVLVVDDEPHTRSGLARFVTSCGHRVITAADGETALAIHRADPADVVLTDWRMPGMGGQELCRRIRELDGDDRYTYVVLATAYDDAAHRLTGMKSGADDYLVKPIDLTQLEARLVSACRVVALDRRRAEKTASLRRDSVRLLAVAHTDALTGLANRRGLDEDLETLWRTTARYRTRPSIAIVDVDHFKTYNDRFGHLAGDEVLRSIGRTLNADMRAGDRIYRYGGDELVAIFPEPSNGEAAANRLREAVALLRIVHPDRPGGVVTVSIGVATLDPSRDESADAWLRRADAALYRAKSEGRDRVVKAE
jgi:diguanylate cyclase (GGDEF)-like protein